MAAEIDRALEAFDVSGDGRANQGDHKDALETDVADVDAIELLVVGGDPSQ